ncbi:MAG: hypothetical protein J6I50_05650 [Clostridia bacterium]|nr:hypothetical protein [Clostridia bacterium]
MKFEQTWQGALLADKNPDSVITAFPAEVPGNLQYDLAVKEGIADTLMYGTTAKRFLELEDHFWKYETTLDYTVKAGERVFFVAEGIDYIFDIFLDGSCIYSHEGMYTKTELDVTDTVHPGSKLTVLIHPHPKLPGEFATPREMAAQSCKPPATYEWDWNPRLIISGIWKPCYIETRTQGYIRRCEPFYTLNTERTTAEVRFETDCDVPCTYTVADRDGNIVYEGTEPACTLEHIHLWWCNGQGEAYLYTWTAKNAEHSISGKIGFRTVRLVMNRGGADHEPLEFPKSRYPAPITIELNGRRIFSKGSNWVNPDLFFGRVTEEQYRTLLVAAKEANMNILRLWGGSGLKKREFYDICDELGIMLWQEFMLACNNYVGTPEYLRILEQEATAVIKELRCHPSIVMWCGGNELFNDWSCMDDQSHALRLLNKLCYEHDFARPFIMTSPLIGMKHGCYVFDDGKQQVYEMFQKGHGTAYSEFGVPSTASVENLKKIIPENELFPIEKTESWLYHHAFKAWGEERWLCLDIVEKYFGKPTCIEDVVNATQWMQCEGYKAIFEEARRQWPYCSMAINWCYNEPWITAANNALFTYPAEKKPAYDAVKDSLRNTIASARIPKFDWHAGEEFSFELWYLNDAPYEVSDTIHAFLTVGDKRLKLADWTTGTVGANENCKGETVTVTLPAVDASELHLILESENGNSTEYRLLYRL